MFCFLLFKFFIFAFMSLPSPCDNLSDQLKELVASLPRKLVVFVTHHHHDHIDGMF